MAITPSILTNVLEGKRIRRYPDGQILLYQGDVPYEVLVLRSGVVKIYDIDENDNEKILQLMGPGAILPLAFFSGENEPTHWFYAAVVECDVYALPASELTKSMRADSDLALYLTHWFSKEMHELLVRLSSMGKTNARDKMLAILKFLSVHFADQLPRSRWQRVTFPVSHQFLANMTGITRESAAATMKLFQREHTARYPRQAVLEINARKLL